MAKKKRRTELDIDPSILSETEKEAPPEPDESAPPERSGEAPPISAPDEAGRPAKKLNKVKLLIVISAGAGTLLLAAAIIWGVVSYLETEPEETETAADVNVEKAAAPITEVEVEIPAIFEFKPFLLEIGKDGKKDLISITFSAQMSDIKVTDEIKRNIVLIRENIYYFLKTKSLDDFHNEEKKTRVAVDMAIVLNRSIQSGAITKVYVSSLTIK